MIWFTSDWHIGHNKEFLYGKRGFSSIEEHDKEILKRCNEVVGIGDELWILGDLAMSGDEYEWSSIYKSLICRNVHFIQGNHDTDRKMDIYEDEYNFTFHGYADMLKYSKKKRFYLCHYPTICSPNHGDKIPIVCLYGHTHQTTNFYENNPYVYHVGVDSHNCYPVSIEQVIKDIEKEVAKYEK